MTQMALPLGWSADPAGDAFLVTPSTAAAVRLIEDWASWPGHAALLTGPARSGRSLLARIFAAKAGGTVIDGAERVAEVDLFHAWNRAGADAPLLLVADAAPSAWPIALPDLRSRIAAAPHAAIAAPDDQLVAALLERMFHARGIDARPDLLDWLGARLERSHRAIEHAVDLLDRGMLERRGRLTIPLARAVLADAGMLPGATESA